MKAETRSIENIYWSWRKYLAAQLPTYRRFYNPPSQPKPTDVDVWIVWQLGTYDPRLFTDSVPRIHCVSRSDTDGSGLIGVVGDVLSVVDNRSTGKRRIDFYDKDTAVKIGDIWVRDVSVGIEVPYDTGITSKAITIHTQVKTARQMR